MSAESSGVTKEINRIKIIQDVIERRITRAVRPSTSVSATGNAADFLPVTVGGPLGMASRRWHAW
jgi:hypothetical protein